MATEKQELQMILSEERNKYIDYLKQQLSETQNELACCRTKLSTITNKERDELECKIREELGDRMPYPEYTNEQVAGFVREVVKERDLFKTQLDDHTHAVIAKADSSKIKSISTNTNRITNEMLDELERMLQPGLASPLDLWIDRARAAIRAPQAEPETPPASFPRPSLGYGDPRLHDPSDDIHGTLDDLAGEIASGINRLSLESESDTPDWISGEFLASVFAAFNRAVTQRDASRVHAKSPETDPSTFVDQTREMFPDAEPEPPAPAETELTAAARARDAIVKRLAEAGIGYPSQGSPDEAAEHVISRAVEIVRRHHSAPAEAEGPTHTERLIRFVMDAAALDLQPWISSVGEVHFQDHLTVTDTEAAAVRAALLGGTAEQGRLVKPPTDEDRWSDLDRAWAMNAKAHLQALADIFGHDEDVTFDQALEDVRRRLSLKPPETREEKLRALVDLAWELGDECLIWDKEVHVSVALMNDAERTMLLAHRDEKRKAAESAKDGAK